MNKYLSNKPCRIIDYWAVLPWGLTFHQQRYRPSDSNKNVDIRDTRNIF